MAPQGKFGLIDDPPEFTMSAFKGKAISVHWESMFTRSSFQTPDMIAQHMLLNDVADLIDKGVLRTTLDQTFGTINAANLKRAHALLEWESRAARSCWRDGSGPNNWVDRRTDSRDACPSRSGTAVAKDPGANCRGYGRQEYLLDMIRMFLLAAMASACVAGSSSIAAAQGTYPEKQLQLILPFPAGGASDVVGRIIASELETRLGKPVIVMNRPGGGTIIGAREAANAAPDGYTLFFSSNSTFTLQNAVKETVPFDSAKDFEPIAQDRHHRHGAGDPSR